MADNARPNVIWIFGDQHRAQATSCNGDPNLSTPNIDALAATAGVNFERAVSGFPLCCPFRGSMLTGLYPHHAVPGHEHRLDPEQRTIAHVFNDNGYDTAYFGKWHVDGFHEREGRAAFHIIPPERRGGFRTWIGYENNNSQYDCWVHGGEGDDAFHYRLPGYETDELTNLLIQYLEDRTTAGGAAQPFFAALSVQPPHDPYVSPPQFMSRHNPATIELRPNVPASHPRLSEWRRELAGAYGQIENLDWNVGRIVDALKKTGNYWNTRIVFFSDHGDMHGCHGQTRKTTVYEESIRIPFLIHDPGDTYYRSRRVDMPINHVDIAPTTLGLCGIEPPDWMEGFDYSPVLTAGRRGPGPAVESGFPDSAFLQSVIPTGHGHSVNKSWRAIVTRDGWKYACFDDVDWLMFNLNEDPYELCNLAHDNVYRTERTRLKDRLRGWIADTNDEFTVPEEPA